jgi:hypothetical protein
MPNRFGKAMDRCMSIESDRGLCHSGYVRDRGKKDVWAPATSQPVAPYGELLHTHILAHLLVQWCISRGEERRRGDVPSRWKII